MRLIPQTESFDESDKAKIHERYLGLIASVVTFVIWFPVLFALDLTGYEINVIISTLCGSVPFFGYLLPAEQS